MQLQYNNFIKKNANFAIMKTSTATEVIIAYPKNKDTYDALKAFMKALKINFEIHSKNESPYDPEFVKTILDGDKAIREGKGKKITLGDLDKLWK